MMTNPILGFIWEQSDNGEYKRLRIVTDYRNTATKLSIAPATQSKMSDQKTKVVISPNSLAGHCNRKNLTKQLRLAKMQFYQTVLWYWPLLFNR